MTLVKCRLVSLEREGEADGGYGRKKLKKSNLGTKNAACLECIKKI